MMKDLKSMSRGGHVGVGGVQAWSAGDLFPWTIYTIEHYVPLTVRRGGVECSTGVEDKSLADRFLWAEVRMSHPDGLDVLLTTIMRGDDALAAHAKAQRKAENAIRVMKCLDTMDRVLGYGQPKMAAKARRDQIAELVNTTLAKVRADKAVEIVHPDIENIKRAADREAILKAPIANTVMTMPVDPLGAILYNHTEGYDHGTTEVDYFGGGMCSGCPSASECGPEGTPAKCGLNSRKDPTKPAATTAEARMKHLANWGCT